MLLLWAMFGKVGSLGATEPGPGISDGQAMFMALILTVGLFSVILGTASKSQNLGVVGAFGVGSYIILAGLWASPISGASMNPARTFGPDLVGANFTDYWVYVVGPIAGAALAVGAAFVLRGSGGGKAGSAAAQGALFRRPRAPIRPEPGGRPSDPIREERMDVRTWLESLSGAWEEDAGTAPASRAIT